MLLYSFKLGLKINNEHPPPPSPALTLMVVILILTAEIEMMKIILISTISAASVAFALCVHGDHYCLQFWGDGGGGCLPTSSAPKGLKLTGFIDIYYLSSCAKWLIFEIHSSKMGIYGYFNHFMLFKLKNKVVERFSHKKIYYPVHFHGDRSPMSRAIKGEKSGVNINWVPDPGSHPQTKPIRCEFRNRVYPIWKKKNV